MASVLLMPMNGYHTDLSAHAALSAGHCLLVTLSCQACCTVSGLMPRTAELAPTFTRVAQELRSQYLLGFAPATLDGKQHRLEVRVRGGLSVRARKSYLATPDRTVSQ